MTEQLQRPYRIQTDYDMSKIDAEGVEALINIHQAFIPRFKKLQRYYEGESEILKRRRKDSSKSNNKIVSGYASYIVDIFQGMFVGNPITYSSTESDYLGELQNVFDENDEQDENSEITKMAGIKGVAYEIVYMDEDAKVRFNEIDADNMIVVYDVKIQPEMTGAIRLYEQNDPISKATTSVAEVYTVDEIIRFEKEGKGKYVEVSREVHFFNEVPVVEYMNNDEYLGDFERVISYIDAYDKTVSDTANDFEEFTDAFLILMGMQGTTVEDVVRMKEDRILLTDGEKQGAEWLIKELNDTALENHKSRLNDDIHKFSKVPDMSDEQFAGNVSGIALQHKLLALEQVLAGKERKFKRALQKRIRLITEMFNKFDKNYDYTDIDITFKRNIPVNIKEAVEIAGMLLGFTSTDTALAQLPMIDNIQTELEKIENERGAYPTFDLDAYGDESEPEPEITEDDDEET
jgi:SPP1 family phage portal protein